ncbi:TerB N-terminal domain-containing protein [Methylocystis heyeri]|uniref:tellurite resistance TerB family protein n=1 Tax=Methylocystis heyeri TaxID=391905 RepID=UPI0013894641|nr:TerB N-terminal domain-containing protein [Methylocystis heyeri]
MERRLDTYEVALKALTGGALFHSSEANSEKIAIEKIEEDTKSKISVGGEDCSSKINSAEKRGEWIPSGQSVSIQNRIIEGGLFYYGGVLPRLGGGGNENCLINPDLKIEEQGDGATHLDYWPDYARLSPASRKAYLDWLSGSRDYQKTDICCIFLYFYGLERRLFLDNTTSGEVVIILNEVNRLINVYRQNQSFHRYAAALLEAMDIRSGEASLDLSIGTLSDLDKLSNFGEIPLALRVALGRRARDGQTVEPDLLLAFVLAHPETRVRAPARKALPELRLLFDAAARRAFPNGARFSRAGRARRLELNYRAASGSFEAPILSKEQGLPDVCGLAEPLTTARRLLDACTDQLDAFSREIGRSKGLKPTLAAVARLPAEIRFEAAQALSSSPLARLAELVEKRAPVDPRTFAECLDLPEPARADSGQIREWARILAAFGYGITADPQFALRRRRECAAFVVFLLDKPFDVLEPPTEAFRSTQAAVALGVATALADGDLDARERDMLYNFIDAASGLRDDEGCRLRAEIIMQTADPFTLSELRSRLKQTTSRTRSKMADYVIKVAAADGKLEPSEVTFIEKMFRLLDLDVSDLYSRLNTTITVSDRSKTTSSQEKRELPSSTPLAASPGSLDSARLASIRAETAGAASLLAAIFADEDPEALVVSPDAVSPIVSDSGLDPRHHSLLLQLKDREEWPRRDFEKMARSVDLMPGAVLETLNEWALDRHDEILLEGDDPIAVNLHILSTEAQQVSA